MLLKQCLVPLGPEHNRQCPSLQWRESNFDQFFKLSPFQIPFTNLWLKNKHLKDTLKAFDDFKHKHKSVWSNVFWYIKVYIFWKCI